MIPVLILDLDFHLSDRKSWQGRIVEKAAQLVFLGVLLGAISSPAFARKWHFSPDLSEDQRPFALKDADIKDAEELQTLLIEIAKMYPYANLKARLDGEEWVVEGDAYLAIRDIEFKTATRNLAKVLAPVRQRFVGKPNTKKVTEAIEQAVLNTLKSNGYNQAEVKIRSHVFPSYVDLEVSVRKEIFCILDRVIFSFKVPKNLRDTFDAGESCAIPLIERRVDSFEEELKSKGYRNAQLKVDRIDFTADFRHASVVISGEIGTRVIFNVREENKLLEYNDIVSNSDFSEIDPYVTNPETMKSELLKFYISKGYLDAKITDMVATVVDEQTTRYTIHVSPQELHTIEEIKFEGQTVFSEGDLNAALGFAPFWQTKVPFNREEVTKGIEKIRAIYQRQGYWDIKIDFPSVAKNNSDQSVALIFRIEEGKQRIFSNIKVVGNKSFPTSVLRSLLQVDDLDPIDRSKLLQFEEAMMSYYLERGYNFCQISIKVNARPTANNVPITVLVFIEEGPRVKIGEITVSGLESTEEYVVRRELLFDKGEWYSPELIHKSRTALINIGIFRSVQILKDPEDVFHKADTCDIVVAVQEGNAGNIQFGPGYKLKKGLQYHSEISYSNLAGTSRKISLTASISEEQNQQSISDENSKMGRLLLGRKIGLGYVEPFLFTLPVDGKIGITHLATADDMWQISNNLDLALSFRTDFGFSGLNLSPFYSLKQSQDIGSKVQTLSLVSIGEAKIGRVGLRAKYDQRDTISWPRAGYFIRGELATAQYYLGGEYKFYRWELAYKGFLGLPWDLVLDYGISLTSFLDVQRQGNVNSGVLPASERLLAGGNTLVRGFEQQLGPYAYTVQGPEPLGGTKRTVIKLEFKKKITESLGVSLGLDSGNTFFSAQEYDKFSRKFSQNSASGQQTSIEDNDAYEFADLISHPEFAWKKHYVSYAFALSWINPLGPLNLAIAFPLHEPESKACSEEGRCFYRSKQKDMWIKRAEIEMSIGTDL